MRTRRCDYSLDMCELISRPRRAGLFTEPGPGARRRAGPGRALERQCRPLRSRMRTSSRMAAPRPSATQWS
jgi:hypothetical protein